MDANGTRFHLLQGEPDWSRCRIAGGDRVSASSRHLRWNAQRNEVTLEPKTFQFVAGKGDRPVSITDRRGAARDRFGNWYWIDPDEQSILVRSMGSDSVSAFWPPAEEEPTAAVADEGSFHSCAPVRRLPVSLQGLAVTEDHYLIAGTIEPAGVLIFDLYSGGPPRQRAWFAGDPPAFLPHALAPREGGGVWILGTDMRVWELDRRFELVLDDPGIAPSLEEGRFTSPDGAERECAVPRSWDRSRVGWKIPEAKDPVSIVALTGRGVLILDRMLGETPRMYWLERRREHERSVEAADPFRQSVVVLSSLPSKLAAHDFAFAAREPEDPDQWHGRLYVVDGAGNQAYTLGVVIEGDSLSLLPVEKYFPMRLFGGRALVAADGETWYDCAETWVRLVHQNRPRYEESGQLQTPVLDSGEPGCVWHRLMLDACIPPGAQVEVYSRAADDWRELTRLEWLSDVERRALGAPQGQDPQESASEDELAEWQAEPKPYLRGDGRELPYLPREDGGGRGTWELLFQRARGRYLQVRLVLSGDGRSTPRLRALRAWFPRFSYLDHYLPAVYREDVQSASFLDRFLANAEGMLTTIEERIAAAQMLFDVDSAPPEALDWLGRWFGVALNPSWQSERRRLFIRHAVDFFAARGTVRGLQLGLRLALDDCIDENLFTKPDPARAASVRIIERFRTRRTPSPLLGDIGTAVPRHLQQDPNLRWQPMSGAAELHRRYRKALGLTAGVELPLAVEDAPPNKTTEWREFVQATLGFEPAVGAAERAEWRKFLKPGHGLSSASASLPQDEPDPVNPKADWRVFLAGTANRERRLWQDFLARRYRSIGALNAAWGTRWLGFATIALADTVPQGDAALVDWFEFEGLVLAMQRTAHRFTVMLPITPHVRSDTAAQQRRFALARAVLDLEKPAHTVFDMRFYWAMFRLGEARIGDDTVIGQGSRAPELMAPMVLGQGYLAETFLAAHAGREAAARLQIGRDRIGRSAQLGGP